MTRRKALYFESNAKTWDCGLLVYAVARDVACWQLERSEADVSFLLNGLEVDFEDLKFKQLT